MGKTSNKRKKIIKKEGRRDKTPLNHTCSAALLHLAIVTSSRVPCTSMRSSASLLTSMPAGSRMALTSPSLFLFPVMKFTTWVAEEDASEAILRWRFWGFGP